MLILAPRRQEIVKFTTEKVVVVLELLLQTQEIQGPPNMRSATRVLMFSPLPLTHLLGQVVTHRDYDVELTHGP